MKLGAFLLLAGVVTFFFAERLGRFGDSLGGALVAFGLISMWVYVSRRWKRGGQKTRKSG